MRRSCAPPTRSNFPAASSSPTRCPRRAAGPDTHDRLLAEALQAAHTQGVTGKETTPFLLEYLHHVHEGTSVDVNLEIVRSNCRLAAEIASAFQGG